MIRTNEIEAYGGGAVVVRRGTGAADAAYLRAVAARLAEATHPGVVEVRSTSDDPEEFVVRLGYAGRPVDQVGHLSVDQVAGITAAVAEILADLHGTGVVHGAIDASHVLVGAEGRPRLCGFGPLAAPSSAPEHDVAAVGALIVSLLGSEPDLEPIPDRRWRHRTKWAGWARRSLLMVADQAAAEPPTRRPTARRLAAAIADAVPGASLVVPPRDSAVQNDPELIDADPFAALRPPVGIDPPARPLPALVVALAAVVVIGLGAVRVARPMLAGDTVAVGPLTAVRPTTVPSTTIPRPSVVVDGTTVALGQRRYQVGQPGDVVVVGDWDGDGMPTPAALRPTTGEVFVFSTWANDVDITVEALTIVATAVELVVERAGGRDALAVLRSDGSRLEDVIGADT